jgi:hypothetical protein
MSTNTADKQHGRVKIDDPNQRVEGQSIEKWTENWAQWMAHAPADSPVDTLFGVSDGGAPASPANANINNNGDVFFLAGGDWPNAIDPKIPVIDVGPDKPILLPMINVVDTEGPGIESITDFVANGRGTYADEARFITHLAEQAITEAHLTVTRVGETKPLIDIHGNDTLKYTVETGTFALGTPQATDYIGSLVGTDPALKNLPFTSEIGRWAMLELSAGDYIVNFGGSATPVIDPGGVHQPIFGNGFQHETTVQLHIEAPPHHS